MSTVRVIWRGMGKDFGHGVAHYRLGVARYRLAAWTTASAWALGSGLLHPSAGSTRPAPLWVL
jgi:hypothetical protein